MLLDRGLRIRTADSGLQTADYGLRATDCGLQTADYRQRTTNCGLQTSDCGLHPQ
ncbi:MAG: hypothetical protein K0R28_2260 [Paenibacillus sp.]|nr:hypothetical protein [Paenibacillus sp.]